MLLVSKKHLESYQENDITDKRINDLSQLGDEDLVCQQWLLQSVAKRFIFEYMYGAVLDSSKPLKILDVGGGLTCITRKLASQHNYELVELLAHDSHNQAQKMITETGKQFILEEDWLNIPDDKYDLVIANDIFPNVDQRLDLFLSRFLPVTKKLRISLTYYNDPRFYFTRRIEGEEILCFLAWNGSQLQEVLKKYSGQIDSYSTSVIEQNNESVYPNGRQVCIVEFKGELSCD